MRNRFTDILPLLAACCLAASCSMPASSETEEAPPAEAEPPEPPLPACEHVVTADAHEQRAAPADADQATNRLRISGRAFTWNGQSIAQGTLRDYLQLISQIVPAPILIVDIAADASPQTVDQARTMVDNALSCDSRAAFAAPRAST